MFCDTGKICYDTRKQAATAAANLSRGDRKNKYSFYKCPVCGSFHTNTVKKNRGLLPKKASKYPLKYTWPLPKEKTKKQKRKR